MPEPAQTFALQVMSSTVLCSSGKAAHLIRGGKLVHMHRGINAEHAIGNVALLVIRDAKLSPTERVEALSALRDYCHTHHIRNVFDRPNRQADENNEAVYELFVLTGEYSVYPRSVPGEKI